MTQKTVSITLLKKTYHIKCEEAEVAALEKVSRYLDNTMRQIKQKGPGDFSDIAILAALNIGNELYLHAQKEQIEPTETPPEATLQIAIEHVRTRLQDALGLNDKPDTPEPSMS